MPAQQCNTATELDCLGTDEAKHMGRFDIQLAHWREQHRIAVEDLKASPPVWDEENGGRLWRGLG
jgi:hypothetical protein